MKNWSFVVITKNEKIRTVTVKSKHLRGAVKRVYQEYDVEDIKAIIEV